MRQRLKLLCALVIVVVCVCGFAPAGAASIEADREASAPPRIRVGSYNITVHTTVDLFGLAVAAFLPKVHIAGLQEVDQTLKQELLAGYELLGWGHYAPARYQGYQNAVLWRTSRFRELSTGEAKISPRWFIADENEKQGSHIKEKHVTVVRLQDRLTGQTVSVVNVHLMNGAIQGGRARPGVPRTYALLVHQIQELETIVSRERANSDRLFVLGDFNVGWLADSQVRHRKLVFRMMRRQGMVANWATEHPKRRGTMKGALLDQVYSEKKALVARVLFGLDYSDHRPAYAVYPGR